MKKIFTFLVFLGMALFLPLNTISAEQDLKESVCIVQRNLSKSDQNALEETCKTLYSLSYMSAARQLGKSFSSFGSGFVTKGTDGKLVVITNKHVVDDALWVSLIFQSETGNDTITNNVVLSISDSTDIAIVQLNAKASSKFTPLEINTTNLKDGTSVWSAGFPGLGDEPSWQLGNGIISNSKYHNLELTDSANISVIQHTAQVDPGSSGGPLLTLNKGKYTVIGMNTWKATQRENANFSINATDILKFLDGKFYTKANSKKIINDNDDLLIQANKFIASIDQSNDSIASFVSNKMVLNIPSDQLKGMISIVSNDANLKLRSGEPIKGLKLMLADNIKKTIKKSVYLTIESVSSTTDSSIVSFVNKKNHYTTSWVVEENEWKIKSTDIFNERATQAAKRRRDNSNDQGTFLAEKGFRILNFSDRHSVSVAYFTPTLNDLKGEDDSHFTDKFKIGAQYAKMFNKFGFYSANIDFGMIEGNKEDSFTFEDDNKAGALSYSFAVGAQCPMAVGRFFFSPEVAAHAGMRIGDGVAFTPQAEGGLNLGIILTNSKILYIGGAYNYRWILGLTDSGIKNLGYIAARLGLIF